MLKSPLFEFTGTVAPDATVPLDDFELGIVQAVIQSSMKADYVDENGRVTWTCTIRAPASRDSADDSPIWYDKDSVKSLNAAEGRTVSSNDSPQNVVPWQTKDKKGALVATSGADVLCTWLAARQKSTGTFTFLCWAMWSIDWGCTFDFKQNTRTLTGREGITESHDGQGPYTPITAGKSANEQISMVWSGPPGGF
jgi:hypothetical protein